MTSTVVASVVKTAVATAWDTGVAAVREENTEFDPGGNPWIQFRFPGSHITRGDIGEPEAPMRDEAGAFMVDVFVPRGVGDDLARAIADAIWDIFALKNISGVRFDERLMGQSGEREQEGVAGVWWGLSYGIRYRYLSV